MEDLLEKYVNERNAEAAAQANLRLLYEMVHDNDVTLEKAAKRADMSEDAFQAAMQAYEASQKS
ncbi:MAG: hypothetical protein HDQ87_06075 [Clostridia bacterium]|nr:hypothetical protein [Clostridia bacterium]